MIDGDDKRAAVESVLHRFAAQVAPRLHHQPRQVVHNDANDYNVLLDEYGHDEWRDRLRRRGGDVARQRGRDRCALRDDRRAGPGRRGAAARRRLPRRVAAVRCRGGCPLRPDPHPLRGEHLHGGQADRATTPTTLPPHQPGRRVGPPATAARREPSHCHDAPPRACRPMPCPPRRRIERWIEQNGHRFSPCSSATCRRRTCTVGGPDPQRRSTAELRRQLVVAVGRFGEDRNVYSTPEFATADPERAPHGPRRHRPVRAGRARPCSRRSTASSPTSGTIPCASASVASSLLEHAPTGDGPVLDAVRPSRRPPASNGSTPGNACRPARSSPGSARARRTATGLRTCTSR